MSVDVEVRYASLFEFVEDYRENLSSLQYSAKGVEGLAVGDFVSLRVHVPVFDEVVAISARVMAVMPEMVGLELQPGEDAEMDQLEGFYRFVGAVIEDMLISGRFQVTGQWAEGARPVASAPGAAAVKAPSGGVALLTGVPSEGDLGEPEFSGSGQSEELLSAMLRLFEAKAQGVLEITQDDRRRVAYVSKGGIVQWAADPVVVEECLGVLLARAGRITEEQLGKSLQMMNETGQQQGQCLIDMGLLSFPQLVLGLMTQVEIVSRAVVGGAEARFAFYPVSSFGREFVTPPMKVPAFVYGYTKKKLMALSPQELAEAQMPLMDQYMQVSQDAAYDEMKMKKAERRLVELLTKKSYRMREGFTISPLGRGPTLVTMLTLAEMGLIQFRSGEEASQKQERWGKQLRTKLRNMEDQHAFDVMEVHWTSQDGQVEASYARLTKEYKHFARDAELPADLDEIRNKIVAQLESAYGQIRTKVGRQTLRKQHFEPQQHSFAAGLLFQQGEMLMLRHRWKEVIDDFERACELVPEDPKYRKYLVLAKTKAAGG